MFDQEVVSAKFLQRKRPFRCVYEENEQFEGLDARQIISGFGSGSYHANANIGGASEKEEAS